MEFVFVRHGEPAWIQDGIARMDPGLTPRGHRQALRTADRLRGTPADALWVSPAQRALDTCAPIAEALHLAPRVLPWLLEAQPPDVEGLSAETLVEMFRHSRRRSIPLWWDGWEGGESPRDFVARVGGGLDEELAALGGSWLSAHNHRLLRALPRDWRVVVVCHAGTAAAALSHLLALDQVPWAWERFYLGHAGLASARTVPIADGLIFSLRSFNDVEHQAPEDRTM